MNNQYAIGITTFEKRFDDFFKPLVLSIRSQNSNVPILVAINGESEKDFCESYRKNILKFCSEQNFIYPIFHTEFRSLSKLWNNLVITNKYDYTLILNDDIEIGPVFFNELESFHFNRCSEDKSYVINEDERSPFNFSHFMIYREDLIKCGWFDERFLSIGWEDVDFQIKYTQVFNKQINKFVCNSIKNHRPKNHRLQNIQKSNDDDNYARINQEFFNNKYKIHYDKGLLMYEKFIDDCDQYPYEQFFRENRCAMRQIEP